MWLEDVYPGQIFQSDSYLVTADDIKAFASQWDPQPFHCDDEAAQGSFFNGLAASGWHTAAITMRLLVTSSGFTPTNGVIGAGIEGLKWARPVRAGDELSVKAEVLEIRALRSRPGYGLITMRVHTVDRDGQPVQVFTAPLVVQSRSE